MVRLEVGRLSSPLGRIVVVARGPALCAVAFEDRWAVTEAHLRNCFGEIDLVEADDPAHGVSALLAYFDGEVGAVDSLEVDPPGTEFQREVWEALRRLSAGETTSYGRLAAAVGRPGASRAVGAANGANPIAIVVPCHRVVASDGRLHGYAGGLERKRWLLAHEARHTPPRPGCLA